MSEKEDLIALYRKCLKDKWYPLLEKDVSCYISEDCAFCINAMERRNKIEFISLPACKFCRIDPKICHPKEGLFQKLYLTKGVSEERAIERMIEALENKIKELEDEQEK